MSTQDKEEVLDSQATAPMSPTTVQSERGKKKRSLVKKSLRFVITTVIAKRYSEYLQ